MKLRIEDDNGEVLFEKYLDSENVLASSAIPEERGRMMAVLIDGLSFLRPLDGVPPACIAAIDARSRPDLGTVE